MACTLLVTLTGTDNPYLRPRLPLEGMLELFEIGTHGRLISAVFRARLTDAERELGQVKVEFGAPVDVKNPAFTYGSLPAATGPEPDDQEEDDGYPSDAELDALAQFEGTPRQFFAEVHRLWSYQDFVTETTITGEFGTPQVEVTLVTGGWSGNESVVETITRTMAHPLWWYMSQRGGLSVYRVPADMYDFVFPLGLHGSGDDS
jgi:hypothetical protein